MKQNKILKKNGKTKFRLFFSVLLFCALALVVSPFLKKNLIEVVNAANVTGWLWGGSEDSTIGGTIGTIDGNETGVGWISMNSTNPGAGGAVAYSVIVPDSNGSVTGYAWSQNLGWIDFNPQDHCGSAYVAASCTPPSGSAGVYRSGDNLTGWARFVEIAKASATGNSGGYSGWIKMNGGTYGVDVTKMDGTGDNPTYAWSDELGWLDFSTAKVEQPKILKICEGSCTTGGSPIGSSLSMMKDSTKNLKACYNTAGDCNSGGDETGAASWDDTENPADAVNLSGTTTKTVSAHTVGTEKLRVSHDGKIVETDIQVICTLDCSAKDSYCEGEKFTDANNCGVDNCVGEKRCKGSNWEEVAN